MKKNFKTTSFWLALSGATVIILETLSKIIGLNLYSKEVESIILTVCSLLIMLGYVTKKNVSDEKESSKEDLLEDITKEKDKENITQDTKEK